MLSPDVLRRLKTFTRERGPVEVARSSGAWGVQWAIGRARAGRPPTKTFRFDGENVPYAHEVYGYTWMNERTVEVSLGREVMRRHAGARVLEIGNVLAHYGPVEHTVVDKYERAPGVLNIDVVDLDLPERFDLIVSISTLEHVGLDEAVKDPDKPGRAIQRLRGLLAPGGLLWVTLPLGYNPAIDEGLRTGAFGFNRQLALVREPRRNVWREVPPEEAWGTEYDRLLYAAHGLVVAELQT